MCLGPDSNRHRIEVPRDFKSLASTNSATQANQNFVLKISKSSGFAGDLRGGLGVLRNAAKIKILQSIHQRRAGPHKNEAWIGIEPIDNGFADHPLSHLGTTPVNCLFFKKADEL